MKVDLFSTVGAYSRGLDTLANLLAKGEAFAKEKGVSEDEMLDWRLAPDMFNLRQQAQTVIRFAGAWPARAAGTEIPPDPDNVNTLAELRAAIAETKTKLADYKAEHFEGREAEPATVNIGQDMTLPIGQWVPSFATPNFYFHLGMAYAILRMKGVPVGKRDFFAGGI